MKKLIELAKQWIFGKRAESLGPIKLGCTTTYHGCYTTFGDWCNEFNVSMLYDKKAIHLN